MDTERGRFVLQFESNRVIVNDNEFRSLEWRAQEVRAAECPLSPEVVVTPMGREPAWPAVLE